jgi:two-component system chemotaxis response regulator CheB
MAGHDIIVIGASAGGVTALQRLLEDLPGDLGAALFVVLHLSAGAKSALPRILGRASTLPVIEAVDGEAIRAGRVYVAVPDRHLLVRSDGTIRLSRGPKENHTRPAVDALFRSAAVAFGPRVIGVVLTGYLDDGTSGLIAIKARGGISVVQDPDDARYDGMPRNALKGDSPDYCVPLVVMPALLKRLVAEPAPPEELFPVPDRLALEVRVAESEPDEPTEGYVEQLGRPSPFVCPECSGTLFEIEEKKQIRYRCRVGHAYSPKTFEARHGEEVEAALWAATRALEESASLARRMAERARATRRERAAAVYEELAQERSRQAERVRSLLLNGATAPAGVEDD